MSNEINALLQLVDDPDQEVFEQVSKKIVTYGDEILPYLEELEWTSENTFLHHRVEKLYHLIQMEHIKKGLTNWVDSTKPDLLVGACLFNQFSIHSTDFAKTFKTIEKLKRSIWIELHQYLTPLEKIKVVSEIIYHHHKYEGIEINYKRNEDFLLDTLLKEKKGNSFALAVLYLLVCQQLDLPVAILKFPRQFVLAFLQNNHNFAAQASEHNPHILFFIDPAFGSIITHNEIEIFFNRIRTVPSEDYFKPLSNKQVIQHWFLEYANCFPHSIAPELHHDLQTILKILD
jgi:hypothetical protein